MVRIDEDNAGSFSKVKKKGKKELLALILLYLLFRNADYSFYNDYVFSNSIECTAGGW